jgi:hypothetical protein
LTLESVLAVEHQGWESLCRFEGGVFYGDLMTDEALMVLVNGMVMDRATVAAALNQAPPWASYELTEARLVPVAGEAAALVYRATARRDGDDGPFVALMSSVYRVMDDRLRLALYQQTTITH